MTWLALFILLLGRAQAQDEGDYSSFPALIPKQSCFYSSYNGQLTCTCATNDMNVSLDIHFATYTRGANLQRVLVKQCNHVLVSLDFTGVQAGSFPVAFKTIRQVDFEDIIFDEAFSNVQDLELDFNNVETLNLNGLTVSETLRINATNIKNAHFVKTVFKHIPYHGFIIKNAQDLLVKDSVFRYVEPRFILVEDARSVLVMGNQMPINAIQVVQAVDGSHLMISCNRLLDQPVSPECSKTTMTTTTTISTSTPFASTTTTEGSPLLKTATSRNLEGATTTRTIDKIGVTPEIVGGVIAGLLLIILFLIILICVLKRKKKRGSSSKNTTRDSILVEDDPELQKPLSPPDSSILTPLEKHVTGSVSHIVVDTDETSVLVVADEAEDDEEKPKFASPIWIDEIQRNKIFNRQKSLLSHDDLKSKPVMKVLGDSDDDHPQENSRTESDDDYGKDGPSSGVEADISYSPLKEDAQKDASSVESPNSTGKDFDELESLLARGTIYLSPL